MLFILLGIMVLLLPWLLVLLAGRLLDSSNSSRGGFGNMTPGESTAFFLGMLLAVSRDVYKLVSLLVGLLLLVYGVMSSIHAPTILLVISLGVAMIVGLLLWWGDPQRRIRATRRRNRAAALQAREVSRMSENPPST